MTDTQDVAAVETVGFDPDAAFKQAQDHVESIKNQIARQQQIKLSAETAIRDLREQLTKTERIVNAMTPRRRVVKPKETSAPKPAAPKKAAAKKAAAPSA